MRDVVSELFVSVTTAEAAEAASAGVSAVSLIPFWHSGTPQEQRNRSRASRGKAARGCVPMPTNGKRIYGEYAVSKARDFGPLAGPSGTTTGLGGHSTSFHREIRLAFSLVIGLS